MASPTTKKVSDERWVLRRKRPETVGDGNMAREIARECSERRLCSYSHSCVQRSGNTMRSALNCQQRWIENQEKMWQNKLGRSFGNLKFKTIHSRSCNISISTRVHPPRKRDRDHATGKVSGSKHRIGRSAEMMKRHDGTISCIPDKAAMAGYSCTGATT